MFSVWYQIIMTWKIFKKSVSLNEDVLMITNVY